MTEWFEQWFGEEYHALYPHAVNLFTSFGYFRDDGEHGLVVRQVAEVLAPGGRFVLDYLNADQVRVALRPHTEEIAEFPTAVLVRRRFSEEGRYVVKEIEMRDAGRSFQERVQLFSVAELTVLLETNGFRVVDRFGDYDGHAFTADSPRAILLGERA